MKNIRTVQFLVYLALFALTLACTKTTTTYVEQPTACFTTHIKDMWGSLLPGDAAYIDSAVYFRNCSDSTEHITYRWAFGDGATSTEKSPAHRYSKRGKFMVTLFVNNNNLVTDTLQQMVTVFSGQKEITFGEGNYVYPIAVDETASGDFVILGSTGWDNGYFLMLADSLFQQKVAPFYFPAAYKLASMKPTTDGNYILAGSIGNFTRTNELIKIKPDGTHLWNKISTAADADYYVSVTPSPDGGFVAVGSYPVKDQYNNPVEYTRVKKFNATGNLQWERSMYTEGMQMAKEVAVEQDAVIVAGTKKGACYDYCDSVLIVKLDNTGSLVWKNAVFGGLNASLGNMRIIKHSAGNYVVATENTKGIFIFSPAGAFLDRKVTNGNITAISNTGDGHLAVLETNFGNGFRGAVSKIKLDGTRLWYVTSNTQQKMGNSWMCCIDNWPIALQPLRNGGTLAMMRRVNRTATNNFYYVMSFLPLYDNGGLQ